MYEVQDAVDNHLGRDSNQRSGKCPGMLVAKFELVSHQERKVNHAGRDLNLKPLKWPCSQCGY